MREEEDQQSMIDEMDVVTKEDVVSETRDGRGRLFEGTVKIVKKGDLEDGCMMFVANDVDVSSR